MTNKSFKTPMMLQYLEIKKQYADCLLFFRLGDFYELFLDDAKLGSEILGITLTARSRGKDGRIPMAGVPFHAADSYITKLVQAGHKVAICEQVSQPDGKGIVDREVIRIITPGTLIDEKSIEAKTNNYIFSLSLDDKELGLSAVDLSTGYLATLTSQLSANADSAHLTTLLTHYATQYNPTELILSPNIYNNTDLLSQIKSAIYTNIYCYHNWQSYADKPSQQIKRHFGVQTLKGFDLDNKKQSQISIATLLGYLKETQKSDLTHIKNIQSLDTKNHVILDQSAVINLELFSAIRDNNKKNSLLSVIDKTKTAMGGRLLKQTIIKPSTDIKKIKSRLNEVEFFYKDTSLNQQIRESLRHVADIERIISKLSINLGNPRDLIQFKDSLQKILEIKDILETQKYSHTIFVKNIKKIEQLIQLIESHIVDEPPIDPKNGKIIKKGINSKLDKLTHTINNSQEWMNDLEEKERKKTGITSLKIKFNKVFGYYIEISKANLDKVPSYYDRKQTLVNAERFITPDLKKHEDIILNAEVEGNEIEYQIFCDVVKKILDETQLIQDTAQQIAHIDLVTNFAQIALDYRYTKPTLNQKDRIEIKNGRHPVIEQTLGNNQFVPNDTSISSPAKNASHSQSGKQLLLITGPNMAGKSVYMRQVALITLMAHMGSFVPAQSADISIVDRIFVRSGASDMITSGLSTFMVEMVETATILNYATNKSLIIMDEIGRGTSTYDGISIAWSVAEALVTNPKLKAKTLFATHYHELQKLAEVHPESIKNYSMAIKEHKNKPIFLHKLVEGGASHSFGIAVAKLAGIPEEVTKRASELLQMYSEKNIKSKTKNNI